MYFSKQKRSSLQKFCSIVAVSAFVIYMFTAVPGLRPVTCAKRGPFAAITLCKTNKADWNLFYHLGGNGPWVPRKSFDGNQSKLPASCSVKQVHLLARHAERYPTRNAGARHIALLKKLQQPGVRLRGSLDFLRHWSYFTDLNNPTFENLTFSGPYAGTRQASITGAKLKQRYGHLALSDSATNFWTCSSPRDIETARHFATGFFGSTWDINERARLHIIPETVDRGGNTLTPGDTCIKYREDKLEGHDHGYKKLATWQQVFSAGISSRLQRDAGGLHLSPIEVYGMMEMCGFEVLARGTSPWCDVFSRDEWSQFEYARDLLHFYRAGPGNKYAGSMGSLWLSASLRLLQQEAVDGVFLSFVHDSDIIAVIAALGFLDEKSTSQELPDNHVKDGRRWKTSDVVPMGGYLILERVTCSDNSALPRMEGDHVRLLLNDGLVDLEDLIGSGNLPGSTTLEQFRRYIQSREQHFGSFVEVCGLAKDAPSRITFLKQ